MGRTRTTRAAEDDGKRIEIAAGRPAAYERLRETADRPAGRCGDDGDPGYFSWEALHAVLDALDALDGRERTRREVPEGEKWGGEEG